MLEVEKPQAGVVAGVGDQLQHEHRGCNGRPDDPVGTMVASAWDPAGYQLLDSMLMRGLAEKFMARALVSLHPFTI